MTISLYSGTEVGGPDTGLYFLDSFTEDSHFSHTYEVAGVALHIRLDPVIPDEANVPR